MKGVILEIDGKTATSFLMPRHYSGRIPSISKAYGWYTGKPFTQDELKAVVTYGKPATNNLCIGICGAEYGDRVFELNRLCRTDDWHEPLSQLVSASLRRLRAENWIVVSYSDTAMNHHGYIYQACNFIYTGVTKERTDSFAPNGQHARHAKNTDYPEYRQVRSAKHRYIYFCTFDKKRKREWAAALKYPILPYPKGDNDPDYKLGDFKKPTIISTRTGEIVDEPHYENEQYSLFGR